MQEKTIADTVNLTLDFNDVEEGQFADMMERIRAERRALLRATQEKYAKSRASKGDFRAATAENETPVTMSIWRGSRDYDHAVLGILRLIGFGTSCR
ncbi:hypothetical protein [Pseudoalteromonas xiamenensis]|uniref:Uncharacterized protein n=1 Tax=Pseudoalteromonas xiamenensis TaxID=882626 RepID=A0A975DK33_9GAMM|nr:hypothetical protein [Pseudoalteromonas xiamenensis]QTH73273.1 hypothetical protein J5O05_21095 [Pseudoalteromonas xiamenensis]